jgi:hypothetical protein
MGYDLYNKRGDYFGANIAAWDHLTEAALAFDWKPAGTLPPQFDEGGPVTCYDTFEARWEGGYFSNEFQRVSDEDARNLAVALRQAIAAAEGIKGDETARVKFSEWNNLPARAENAARSLNVRFVRRFVKYCEKGAFQIG